MARPRTGTQEPPDVPVDPEPTFEPTVGVEAPPPGFVGQWTIHQRLVAILDELPAIGKNQTNTQQGFKFRGHDDVMAALNPLLGKHGVSILPHVVERIAGERKTSGGKSMYEINLHVEFVFLGAAGDHVVASTWGEGTDLGDKATSKAHTMAFKSALAVVFAISTEEASAQDPDKQTAEETSRGGAQTAPTASRPFDPGVDLREDAPQGEGFQARIGAILEAAAPGADWRATFAPFIEARWGVLSRDDLDDVKLPEYWKRVSNFAAALAQGFDLSAFPALVDREAKGEDVSGADQILRVLTWAFAANPPEAAIVFPEAPPTEPVTPEDDIPFGPGPDAPASPGAGSIEPDAAPDRKQAALDEEAAAAADRDA